MAEKSSASPKPALSEQQQHAQAARPDPQDTLVETPPEEMEVEMKEGTAPVPASGDEEDQPAQDAPEDTTKGDEEPSDKPAEVPTEESKDEAAAPGDTSTGAAAAEPPSNGTPASSKKSKRKSSSGVPEHKAKKLGRKKSQVFTHLNAEPGDYYLARMKGHPPWPSVICDDEMLPMSLLATRPVTAKRPDGTYRDDVAEGGKRMNERTFPIMFLYTNEFAWIPNTDLSELNMDTLDDQAAKAKSKVLKSAFGVAAEKNDLEHYKNLLREHENAVQADEEARAERAAKKGKGKRKAEIVDMEDEDEDVEMEDVGDEPGSEEAGGAPKPKNKKRKKDAESEGEDTKTPKRSASTKKNTPKLKLTNPKTPNGTGESKATPKGGSSAKAGKGKGSGKKAAGKARKEVVEDDDVDAEESPKPEKPLTIAESREQKEKAILFLRHKLQRGFLTRDQVPREEEMKTMSDYIKKLEQYDNLEISIIRSTKINKVLKNVMKLSAIPRDDEFNFKQRSYNLLQKWNNLLSKDGEAGEGSGEAGGEAATNGTAAGKDHDMEGDEGEKTTSPAPAAAPAASASPKAAAPEPEAEAEADKAAADEPEKEQEKEKPTAPEPEPKPAEPEPRPETEDVVPATATEDDKGIEKAEAPSATLEGGLTVGQGEVLEVTETKTLTTEGQGEGEATA